MRSRTSATIVARKKVTVLWGRVRGVWREGRGEGEKEKKVKQSKKRKFEESQVWVIVCLEGESTEFHPGE